MYKNNVGAGPVSAQKGITLIALVITIIVMLILVGVTISMAVNGGLFNYAGNAVSDTNTKLQEEAQLAEGGIEVNGEYFNSIDEYLVASGNKGNGGGEDNPQNPDPEPDTPSGNGITAATMQSNLATYLGQSVNYEVTYTDTSSYGNGDWEIFYADGEHIYIITKGHRASGSLTISEYNGTSDFTETNLQNKYKAVAAGLLNKTYDPAAAGTAEDPYLKYTSSNNNMKATQYLLDSTVWASYANNEYADWAIGAPTFELFVNSFNAYYPDNAATLETPTGTGYANPLSSSGSVPSGTYLNHSTSTGYWLACPSSSSSKSVRDVGESSAYVDAALYNDWHNTFRPVVCLDSDVQITWDSENSEYTLSRVS